MKKTQGVVLILAVALCSIPALAQHGHAGGMGGGTGSGMGMGHAASGMGNAPTSHGPTASTVGSAHGQTMDQILTRNTKLAGQIQSLTGMSAQQACAGFKNLGQCVAAAHVSKKLGISFACLQSDMTGTKAASTASCPAGTGTKSMSLGKSIQTLSPNADSKSEAKKANKQAEQDLQESTS